MGRQSEIYVDAVVLSCAAIKNEVWAQKLVGSPNYKIKNSAANWWSLKKVEGNVFTGVRILELSKYLIIKQIYKNNAKLLFTDIDNLTYHIKTHNIYNDMQLNANKFDFFDYFQKYFLYSDENKVLSKFKDGLCGEAVLQFVGLKAKMYSVQSNVGRYSLGQGKVFWHESSEKEFTHQDYVSCLLDKKISFQEQIRILQDKHQLFIVNQNKKCLCPFDDKRFLLSVGMEDLKKKSAEHIFKCSWTPHF